MREFTEWRGYDLTDRRAKIERAINRQAVTSPEDVPILIWAPAYTAFASKNMPEDNFTNPASMLEFQSRSLEQHLATVDDDLVPYFIPWFGTGVLASGFGCRLTHPGPGDDPAVAGPCVTSPADVARLKMPDPYRDGWMPRVLKMIDYARENGDLPVGLTDMQGPLDTLDQMCGHARLYTWMYHEPAMVHELFDLVTDAFIEWVKVQKKHIGEPLNRSNGLQGAWSPTGVGVWESDDDLVLLGADLYAEFVVPYVSRIFEAFGGGSVHFCGKGIQHVDNLLHIKNIRVVNNSPLGEFETFAEMKRQIGDHVTIQIQDAAPLDVERYYSALYSAMDDFRGVMLVTSALDTMGMTQDGGYVPVEWDVYDVANRIVAVTRECVRKKLAGEPILVEPTEGVFPAAGLAEAKEKAHATLSPERESAIRKVQERLVQFDEEDIKQAVREALDTGLTPFEIVTMGMAEGMAEVGRRYETGEFFLPELVMAGNTMKEGMTILDPLLKAEANGEVSTKGTVVLGTVEGDLHEIGKNIVKTLLEGSGFAVHDIGVDQPTSSFVGKTREVDADIVAMSALLTTTMQNMKDVIDALDENGLRERVAVMVGGAPINREFADRIGAEGYAPDAVKAVHEAERLVEQLRAGRIRR